jgi:hypothetical protein
MGGVYEIFEMGGSIGSKQFVKIREIQSVIAPVLKMMHIVVPGAGQEVQRESPLVFPENFPPRVPEDRQEVIVNYRDDQGDEIDRPREYYQGNAGIQDGFERMEAVSAHRGGNTGFVVDDVDVLHEPRAMQEPVDAVKIQIVEPYEQDSKRQGIPSEEEIESDFSLQKQVKISANDDLKNAERRCRIYDIVPFDLLARVDFFGKKIVTRHEAIQGQQYDKKGAESSVDSKKREVGKANV